MTSITYVGGMNDVTRRRCEKSIRAFLLQWLQCANTSGSFCFTYIKGLSFSFPQVQQHGSSGEVWVQVPERAKRGKFTFGTGVKGAMCRVWSEDQSVSHGDLVCALEEVIPQVQEYYTKKKKSSPTKKEVATHERVPALPKGSVSEEVDTHVPGQKNASVVSEEVQLSVIDFSTNLSAVQILILLYLSQDKEIAFRLFCDYAEEEFRKQLCFVGLSKSDLSNTTTLDGLDVDEEVCQQVCGYILSQYNKDGEHSSRLSVIQEVLFSTIETLKDDNRENANTIAQCAKEVEELREKHTTIALQRNQIFKALSDRQNAYTVLGSKLKEGVKSITFFEQLKTDIEKQQEEVSLMSDFLLIKELAAGKGMDVQTYLAHMSKIS